MTKFRFWISAPILLCASVLSGCFSDGDLGSSSSKMSKSHFLNDSVKFSSRAYGVAASPRVSRSKKVRKGGGRSQVGKRYKIKGKWYKPKDEPGYDKVGNASWYGPNFHGRLTANGEVYDQFALSAAHPTFPLPSYARVTNTANGKSTIVRVNDRGPYHDGRIIDLSARASELLDYQRKGIARVRVQYIGRAPLHGLDEKYLVASFSGKAGFRATTAVAYRKPAINGPRPKIAVKTEMLDTMSTGSITKTDPFQVELAAIAKKQDTGTTLAKRLADQFIYSSVITNIRNSRR